MDLGQHLLASVRLGLVGVFKSVPTSQISLLSSIVKMPSAHSHSVEMLQLVEILLLRPDLLAQVAVFKLRSLILLPCSLTLNQRVCPPCLCVAQVTNVE